MLQDTQKSRKKIVGLVSRFALASRKGISDKRQAWERGAGSDEQNLNPT